MRLRSHAKVVSKARHEFDFDWAARIPHGHGGESYNEATVPAWKAYNEATVTAWKAYKEATDTVLKAIMKPGRRLCKYN